MTRPDKGTRISAHTPACLTMGDKTRRLGWPFVLHIDAGTAIFEMLRDHAAGFLTETPHALWSPVAAISASGHRGLISEAPAQRFFR